jgi:hypothetical protein
MHSTNRRQVLKFIGLTTAGLFLSPLLESKNALADNKVPLVDGKDATAKAVKYVEDFKKAPQAKGNHCGTCSFYKKIEARNGKEVGTCLIFAGKYVFAEAYCNSWAKKA